MASTNSIIKNQGFQIILGLGFGLCCGWLNASEINEFAAAIASVFVNLLKMVSLPLVFLMIISTLTGLEDWQHLRKMGGHILKYTASTTLIAAMVALITYLWINPLQSSSVLNPIANSFSEQNIAGLKEKKNFSHFLLESVPSNFVEPFFSGNVIGILLMALLLSLAILGLEKKQKETCHQFFESMAAAFLKIAEMLLVFIPLAIWAFAVKLWQDLASGLNISSIAYYVVCIVLANLIQAFIILPLFMKAKGLKPIHSFMKMRNALLTAFFSKSSAATLPITIKDMEEKLEVAPQYTRVVIPMCATVNMNACAGFILITYLFVSGFYGVQFSTAEMVSWVFIASLAAAGNAAVPMGCFFLASAFLASSNIPLDLLGVILPIYGVIDMLETAINVWSDICVTQMVEKDLAQDA